MGSHDDDLDLLLSLQDKVLETPPGSPGYLSDDGSPRRRGPVDMSVFRDAVQDCLDYEPKPVEKNDKLNRSTKSKVVDVEKFSGLRIRDQLLSPVETSNHFSDIRFVRLQSIKNLLSVDTLSGCWATIGVLTEKLSPKTSSIGQQYCIWKIGCLGENTISLFLFGDAYQRHCKEQAGTVFGMFNCSVRKDNAGSGFSLSVNSSKQIVKMGTSLDYAVCKGSRKDGMTCTAIVDKRKGQYCKYHKSGASDKFTTRRAELKGGNLGTAFRNRLKSEGIYLVDPLNERTNIRKSAQPVKVLSVEGLKKALSKAGTVTPNAHSQGIRFLAQMTGSKSANDESALPIRQTTSSEKRKPSTNMKDARKEQSDAKRTKTDKATTPSVNQNKQKSTEKMIELDFCSSDEEF